MKRRQRQRVVRSALLAVVAVLVFAWESPASLTGPLAVETEGGYAFSDVSVGPQPDPVTGEAMPGFARVYFNSTWSGSSYPGTRTCTWSVYDAAGNLIGQATGTYIALEPSYASPIYKEVEISGVASSAEIGCAEGRLDDPAGHYRFVEKGVELGSARSADEIRLLFDYAWEGAGGPSPQNCAVRLFAADRLLIEEVQRVFFAADGVGTAAFSLRLTDPTAGIPIAGEIACRPLAESG